ncbi:MAG: hypothetical protein KKE20_03900 [Nanoarchaeota archaeon]|nr:hypothetical protein [Nanoarchaeota archaeon]
MFEQIIFYRILGLPAIAWGGIVTLLCLISTAAIGHYNMKGVNKGMITLKWHKALAGITVLLGLAHAILGILAFI